MLSGDQATAMRGWVMAAQAWGEASQELVGAATGLSTASRSLADTLGAEANAALGDGLGTRLRGLAGLVEADTAGLRERFLETAANLEQYEEVLGLIQED
jgi:hypothetical protein